MAIGPGNEDRPGGDEAEGRSRSARFKRYSFPDNRYLSSFKAYDWICGNCNYINFSDNPVCRSCRIGVRNTRMGVTPGSSESVSVADVLNPSRVHHRE